MLKLQPTKKPRLKTRVRASGVFFCLLFSFCSYANDEQLSGVKKEISRQELQLNANANKLNILQSSLKKQEQSINTFANKIRTTKFNLKSLSTEISTLNLESLRLKQIQKDQMKLLKKLLDSHYRHGNHSQLSTLFSDENTSDMDRMTVYAERLSKVRTQAIYKLDETNKKLDQKLQTLGTQTQKQNTLLAQLQVDKKRLEIEQKRKQKTARAIQHRIRGDKSHLSELKGNEKQLKEQLEIAKEARIKAELNIAKEIDRKKKAQAIVKMDGLRKYKGRLQWPVKGKIIHRYGAQQSGQLNWNGMVISAQEGSEVKATFDGTVVLSNWLRGYGLMLVIDHGKGDMSFYGYNQALLRNVGDTVKIGDPIALVGSSGGQTSSGLYFEIRRKGNATNPSPWLK